MHLVARLSLTRHELRVLGPWLFALPVLVACGLGSLIAILNVRDVSHDFLPQMVTATLEALLPLVAGVLLVTVAPRDPALEVHLSLPTPYRFTVGHRFALLLGWVVLVELVTAAALQAALPWAIAKQGVSYALLWLPPTLCLAAGGALMALLVRSRATAGAVLGVLWVGQQVFHGYFATYGWTRPWFLFATLYAGGASFWLANRLELTVLAMALAIGVWIYLLSAERRLFGEEQ